MSENTDTLYRGGSSTEKHGDELLGLRFVIDETPLNHTLYNENTNYGK